MIARADDGVETGTACDLRLGLEAGRAKHRIGQKNPPSADAFP
jgi:hypothetical protein